MESVYFSNLGDYDITTALGYVKDGGSIKSITRGKINIFRIEPLIEKIHKSMDDMNENDWLVLAGNSFVSALCCSIAYRKFSKLKLLVWDAVAREYKPIESDLDRNFNTSDFQDAEV